MSIRSLTLGDLEEYKALQTFCFWEDMEGRGDKFWDQILAFIGWEDGLCVDVDGRLAATYMVYDFAAYVRGSLVDVGGVYGVATYPEHRRRDYIRDLTVRSLSDMRARGQYVSALQPFKFDFYRRYGYETCAMDTVLTADPRNIRLPEGFKPLQTKWIGMEESYEAVKPLRGRVGRRFNLVMLKTYPEWRFHMFWDRDRLLAAVDGDAVVGYIISRLENKGGKTVLRIMEMIAETEEARLTLLDYVRKHGDQCSQFRWRPLGDEPITDYFHEQWENELKVECHGAVMFRVVDVAKAVEQITYPAALDGEFTLRVRDEWAPWNDGCFRVQVSGGAASVESCEEASPDVETDIQGFTQLYVGYRSITQLVSGRRAKTKPGRMGFVDWCFPRRMTRLLVDF